jgi:hypothetical protein
MSKTPINPRNVIFDKGLSRITIAGEIGRVTVSERIYLTSALISGLASMAEIPSEPG